MCLTILVWTNRIQWTLGEACKSLGLCPEGSVAIAVPMHVSSKNVFFDRFLVGQEVNEKKCEFW